jgi:hypothetical protein
MIARLSFSLLLVAAICLFSAGCTTPEKESVVTDDPVAPAKPGFGSFGGPGAFGGSPKSELQPAPTADR